MEKAMTDLVTGRTGATPVKSSIDQIKKLITGKMLPRVMKAHVQSQKQVDKLSGKTADCSKAKKAGTEIAERHGVQYLATSPLHKTCRTTEAHLRLELDSCQVSWQSQIGIRDLKCKIFDELDRDYGSET